tara:strand:+ start:4273 stop:4938 length:666 start_codon:yes stop_codon:yes gene_type:complete
MLDLNIVLYYMPTDKTFARLNKLHYKISDGDKKTQAKALAKVDKIGYDIQSSSRGVAHFKSKGEDAHHVVTVKGTDPTNKKDLMSDIHLAIGKSGSDKQFKKRTKDIKKIYAGIGDEEKHLTGHSLGGSIVSHAMVKSKSIRDNTKHAHTYNAGYTPAFHNELSKGLTKDDKRELKTKLKHNHNKGDPISAALTINAVGKVSTTSGTAASPHSLDNFSDKE